MSAYIVNENTINGVISYAMDKNLLRYTTPQKMTDILLKENCISVNYRYNESNFLTQTFKYLKGVSLDMFYGAVKNLAYQSCEHGDAWQNSEAYKFLDNCLVELGLNWDEKNIGKDHWGINDNWSFDDEEAKRKAKQEKESAYKARVAKAKSAHDSKEIAKLVRKELKNAFKEEYPNTKFSVTSKYDKVSVRYQDGPARSKVEELLSKFKSGGYDMHTDYFYNSSKLFTVGNVEYYGGVQYMSIEREVSIELAEAIYNAAEGWAKEHSNFVTSNYGWQIKSEDRNNELEIYKLIRNSDELDFEESVKAETAVSFSYEHKGQTLWFTTQQQLDTFKQLLNNF